MDELKQLILFKRNGEFFSTQEEAISGLNLIEFHVGEPVVAIYGTSSTDAKMLVAIGKVNGTGENAYQLISTDEDAADLLQQLNELQTALTEHEETLASGETSGHVKDSSDITFIGGQGTVVAAGKVKNAITFSGYSTDTFDGSEAVTIPIPEAGTTSPIGAGTAAIGVSEKWAREDHVHPAQENVTGNAGSATKLQKPVDITLTGGVTGTASTDFSGALEIETTLSDHTHTTDEITDLQDALDLKAPIADAHFTGTPTAPTAPAGTNTVQIATTAFVVKEISDKLAAAMALTFKGTLGTDGTITTLPSQHTVGDVYIATTGAPSINGVAVEPGDMVICTKTGTASKDSDWSVVQTNIDGAVTGPESSVNGNLAIFQGTNGKQISDSGISLAGLAKSDTSVIAGEGLAGGGNLSQNITITHAEKPGEGTDAGGTGNVVTGVLIDKFGHVSGTTKTTLGGSIAAQTGKYVSSVTLGANGTLEGTLSDLPKVQITGGETTEGQFISSVEVADDGYTINVGKTALPEESGKVKVSEDGTPDFLSAKVVSGAEDGSNNVYPVVVTQNGDKLELTVKIDIIDGGTY